MGELLKAANNAIEEYARANPKASVDDQLQLLAAKYASLASAMDRALNFDECATKLHNWGRPADLLAANFSSVWPGDEGAEVLDAVPAGLQVVPFAPLSKERTAALIGYLPPPLFKAYTANVAATQPKAFAFPEVVGKVMMARPDGKPKGKLFECAGTLAIASWLAHNKDLTRLFRFPPSGFTEKLQPVRFGEDTITLELPPSFGSNTDVTVPVHLSCFPRSDAGLEYPLRSKSKLALSPSFADITKKLLAVGAPGAERPHVYGVIPENTYNLGPDAIIAAPLACAGGGRVVLMLQFKDWFMNVSNGEHVLFSSRFSRQFVTDRFVFRKRSAPQPIANPFVSTGLSKFCEKEHGPTHFIFATVTVNPIAEDQASLAEAFSKACTVRGKKGVSAGCLTALLGTQALHPDEGLIDMVHLQQGIAPTIGHALFASRAQRTFGAIAPATTKRPAS